MLQKKKSKKSTPEIGEKIRKKKKKKKIEKSTPESGGKFFFLKKEFCKKNLGQIEYL